MAIGQGEKIIAPFIPTINKANINLNNITDTAKNIANWSSNITNCITYIPQDIKLELNNGTLTLKAGSKLYDGNGLFTTITSDVNRTETVNGTFMACYKSNGFIQFLIKDSYLSGTTPPQSGSYVFFNTDTKSVGYYTNGVLQQTTSLPLFICTISGGQITSIDQVFNGFGYIGSTVFALPGVKYLESFGKNKDGTYKNVYNTIQEVKTSTITGTYQDVAIWLSSDYNVLNLNLWDYGKTGKAGYITYDKDENIFIGDDNNKFSACIFGTIEVTNSKITNFKPKQVFHALDYNDTSYISTQSCPSDRYIDLTLLASGSRYTAPANGIVAFAKAQLSAQYISLNNITSNYGSKIAYNAQFDPQVFVLCKKGDVFQVDYNATGTTIYFRFIYAEGESNV